MIKNVDFDAFDQIVLHDWAQQIRATRLSASQWAVRIPFNDQFGDPISISISKCDNHILIDDAGVVAGRMFSADEHMEETSTFRLLQELTKSYQLEVDHDEGILRCEALPEFFIDTLSDFAKVVLTLLTASPFLTRRSHRTKRFGPRLTKRIIDGYKERQIIDFVVRRPRMPGHIVEQWPADFHWHLPFATEASNVFVLAADLKVKDPLERAQKVSAIALDTQNARHRDDLRIVIDTAEAAPAGYTAAEFILQHSEMLKYDVYDFGKDIERHRFFDRAADELLSESAREWRLALSQ